MTVRSPLVTVFPKRSCTTTATSASVDPATTDEGCAWNASAAGSEGTTPNGALSPRRPAAVTTSV
ncbi:MAG: hypothetical protein M9894_37235 [Planctomycetes bacterium]|nr:hypothetical protein [Planctomycetota bacterium]